MSNIYVNTFISILIIFLGIFYNKNSKKNQNTVLNVLPPIIKIQIKKERIIYLSNFG